jgi:type IV pilus assembly protein PilF
MNLTRLIIPALMCLPLWGCNQTNNANLRPRAATKDAVTANINVGAEYMREGNYEKALEKLDRARAIDPGYYGTYNIYGLLYQRMGQNADAERNFRKALSLASNDPAVLNNYGQFLCNTDRAVEAEKIFLQASGNPLNQMPEVAWTNAGICVQKSKQLVKAEEYYRRALELNPDLPDALIRMAQISQEQGNALSARAFLQRYLANVKPTAQSLWLGIQIERELGDTNAVSSYALLLKNNFPDSREAGLLGQSGLR